MIEALEWIGEFVYVITGFASVALGLFFISGYIIGEVIKQFKVYAMLLEFCINYRKFKQWKEHRTRDL